MQWPPSPKEIHTSWSSSSQTAFFESQSDSEPNFALSSLGGTMVQEISSPAKTNESSSFAKPLFNNSIPFNLEEQQEETTPVIPLQARGSLAQNIPNAKSGKQQFPDKINIYNSWNGNSTVGTSKMAMGMRPDSSQQNVENNLEHLDVFGVDDENPQNGNRKSSVDSGIEPFEMDHPRSRASSLPGSLAKLPHFKNGANQRTAAWAEESSPHSQKQHKGYESATLYKTELCRSFTETGNCRYGIKCQFAHGAEELRGVYRHPKYKTEICKTFHNLGTCNYGKRCRFIHLTPEADERDRIGFGPNHERLSLPNSSGMWASLGNGRKFSSSSASNPMTVPIDQFSSGNSTFANNWPHNLSAPNEIYFPHQTNGLQDSPPHQQQQNTIQIENTPFGLTIPSNGNHPNHNGNHSNHNGNHSNHNGNHSNHNGNHSNHNSQNNERKSSSASAPNQFTSSINNEDDLPSSFGRLSFFQSLVPREGEVPTNEVQ